MDPELQRQMAAFEAARIAQPVVLHPPEPTRVLAVRDGSDQDDTVLALARTIAGRFDATVDEWAGARDDRAHDAILAAADGVDLIVVPCPFAADFGAVGRETLSTALDVVLTRATVPVLLARAPLADVDACVRHPLVVVDVCTERGAEAASWAVALGDEIALLTVLDPSQPVPRDEVVGRYLDPGELEPDDLRALADARAAALTAAVQRHVYDHDQTARLKIRIGDVVAVALDVAERRRGLVVCGWSRDPATQGRGRALALRSTLPVLLV